VTTAPVATRCFTSDLLAGLDEPVRRYFTHAISDGAALSHGVRMAMHGRIKVGLWLTFTAQQTVDGRSFGWRARVGCGPVTPLRVTDRRFGDLVLPSTLSVGWWLDTPRYAPFVQAEITAVTPTLHAAGRTAPRSPASGPGIDAA
jgi:hypothetical protein